MTTDSFPGKSYTGRVSYISSQAEFTPKTVQTFEERVKLMYRIKVDPRQPGQRTETRHARRWVDRSSGPLRIFHERVVMMSQQAPDHLPNSGQPRP